MISGILKKKITKTLFVALFIPFIISLLLFSGFLETWESRISDAFYAQSNPDNNIVIIAIDDKSMQELGQWPFDRERFATVIDNLNQSFIIGIDVSFFESSTNDSLLAESLNKSKVVLAMEYTSFSHKDGDLYGENLLKPTSTLGTPGENFDIGFVNLYTDLDGVTRSFTPHISGIEDHDHFSMVIVEKLTGSIPILEDSIMLINYFSEPGGYQYISFSDVYNRIIDPSYFQGKIVLIGATAADLHDDVIVPISEKAMPGVEVNANLVQSILTRDFLNRQDNLSALVIIFLFSILAGILLFRFRIIIVTIFLVALFIVYIFLSIYIFDSFGIIMKILYPILSTILVFVTIVVVYYRTEEKSRKWITSVFGKYVSPVVIDNLIKNPDSLILGGEKKDITIFFSDIRGFTSISEKLDPEDLVGLLNEYLTEMSSIIIDNQGLVDKYMGDAIMALWGAPLEQTNHAENACLSSLKMISRLKELNNKWDKDGIPLFNIGIGLNSGDAVVGNMGSSDRFDYTAMGDNVNLASRMEGLNKIYGTNIIITDNTFQMVKDKFETRKLDFVRVKGKRKPVLIHELISEKDRIKKDQLDFIELYETGLDLYISKKWQAAIKSFQSALKIKDDKSSNLFIDRCKEFLKNPPLKDWDGVWELKTK
jgi:adenylate cyclase